MRRERRVPLAELAQAVEAVLEYGSSGYLASGGFYRSGFYSRER